MQSFLFLAAYTDTVREDFSLLHLQQKSTCTILEIFPHTIATNFKLNLMATNVNQNFWSAWISTGFFDMKLLGKQSSVLNRFLLTEESWEALKSWHWVESASKRDAGLHLLILCTEALVYESAFEPRDLAKLDCARKGLSSLMTFPTPSNASPKAITVLLLCQDYVFPYHRRSEQSPKEKGKLLSCQSLGLSQQPPIFNSIANDICDQRARTPGGA